MQYQEIKVSCQHCRSVLGQGPTRELARLSAQDKGHVIEPECRGNLCLCRTCYTLLRGTGV